jgi:hypothetical protein
MVEWRNRMAHWPEARLRGALGDKSLPIAKRLAARDLLAALRESVDNLGRMDPEPGRIRTRIEERSLGRPMQSVEMTGQLSAPRAPNEMREHVVQMIARLVQQDSGLRLAIAAALGRIDSGSAIGNRIIVHSGVDAAQSQSDSELPRDQGDVHPPQGRRPPPGDPLQSSPPRESDLDRACKALTAALQSAPGSSGDPTNGEGN